MILTSVLVDNAASEENFAAKFLINIVVLGNVDEIFLEEQKF